MCQNGACPATKPPSLIPWRKISDPMNPGWFAAGRGGMIESLRAQQPAVRVIQSIAVVFSGFVCAALLCHRDL